MPCNTGYREYVRVTIPVVKKETLRKKVEAPQIDAKLLAKIGADDSKFREWLMELDPAPLWQEALDRVLKKADDLKGIKFSIDKDGYLQAKAKIAGGEDKRTYSAKIDAIGSAFQMEVIGIVAQLLDYEIVIQEAGDEIVLEGEKQSDAKVHEYLRVATSGQGTATLEFEHFSSPDKLKTEERKFLGLAQKFGIKMVIAERVCAGQPIDSSVVHRNFLQTR